MNEIRDLFPGRMRERTFQLKARRDAGAVWHEPQFVECKQCGRRATRTIWTRSLYVCPNCGYHMPIGGYYRLSLVLDHGSFRELDADLPPQDVLRFPGYPEKLTAAQNKTGLREAAVTATGRIGGILMDAGFSGHLAAHLRAVRFWGRALSPLPPCRMPAPRRLPQASTRDGGA